MIAIRAINDNDLDAVKSVGQRYSQETMLGTLSPEQLEAITASCVKDGIVLVADVEKHVVGVIAGKFVEGFSMGKFCEEVIWYVLPEHRGVGLLLFERFLSSCQAAGCKGVAMSAYNNEYLKVVDRLYRKNGFEEVDRRYYKRF